MKILILSRYDRRGASSRLRTMQYIPYLSRAGFDVEVASLFDADYLDADVCRPAVYRFHETLLLEPASPTEKLRGSGMARKGGIALDTLADRKACVA